MGESLLVIVEVRFLERNAGIKRQAHAEHEQTGIQIGFVKSVIVNVSCQVAGKGNEATRRRSEHVESARSAP